jgi:hypothetical protein
MAPLPVRLQSGDLDNGHGPGANGELSFSQPPAERGLHTRTLSFSELQR